MNIYDLKESKDNQYLYDTYAKGLIKKYKESIKIYKGIIISFLIAVVRLYYNLNKNTSLQEDFLTAFLWIVIISILCFIITLVLKMQKMLKKSANNSIQSLHDCYYYLYKIVKGKKNKNSYLLKLCMCNIIMHEFERGLMCLELIELKYLSNHYKFNYYIQKSIINKFMGNEYELQNNIESCEKFLEANKKSKVELRKLNILKYGTMEQIYNLVTPDKLKRQYKLIVDVLYIFNFIIISFGFARVQTVLPKSIEYRSWLEFLGCTIIFLGSAFILGLIVYEVIKLKCNNENIKLAKIMFMIFLVPYLVLICFLGTSVFKNISTETTINDAILIINKEKDSYVGSYYCKPCTIFFRQKISDDEEHNKNKENTSNNEKSYYEQNTESDSKKNVEDKDNYDVNEMYGENESVMMGYHKIYSAEFQKYGDTMEFKTSAKGRTYVVIGPEKEKEFQGSKVKTLRRVVFDKESNNGQYNQYVYYEDYYGDDGNNIDSTSILNFYAVNKSTGKVISGEKTSWEESGSEEYRNAVQD